MAKIGLSQITTAQTFQTWLDRTNEIVDIIGADAMTASTLGDTTVGNATLIGSFTANTVVAFDTLRTNVLSPKVGSTSISIIAPITVTASGQTTQTLSSVSGPRSLYSSGSLIWTAGFENTSTNRFVINTGTGINKLALSTSGDLTVAGSIYAGAGGTVTGDLIGNVTGTVSSLSNHSTSDLAEGTNQYFTTTRARASFTASTGIAITNGAISIGQAVATNSNVTFNNQTLTGALNIKPVAGNAAIELGRTDGVATNPFIDFHTSGNNTDYDSRILALNGSAAIGSGALNYIANGGHYFYGSIQSDGDITAFGSFSDANKKENVLYIENALEKVSQIGGYTFNYIGDDRKMTGVIAQEIEKVLPEVVYEIEEENGNVSKAVRYGNIVGLLIEAIKELNSELDLLKAKMEDKN